MRLAAVPVLLFAISPVPGMAGEDPVPDPFAALPVVDEGPLDHLRAAGIRAETGVESEIGTIAIEAGSVRGGAVRLSGKALSQFRGINTMSFSTGHGNNTIAATTLTIVLRP